MRHHSGTKKSINAMAGAVEELIGDHEIQRLVFFFQRPHGGNRNNPVDTKLFEAMNVRAEIQLAGKNAVTAPVPRQESNFAAFQ